MSRRRRAREEEVSEPEEDDSGHQDDSGQQEDEPSEESAPPEPGRRWEAVVNRASESVALRE